MYDFLHKTLGVPYELYAKKYGDWSNATQPVIVLIHGIGVNHRIWDDVITQLDPAPILAVDLLGFGASRKPDWAHYSLADHAKALQKTIRRKAQNRPIILCGHSLGSLVAIQYETQFPRAVAAIVLCSPPIYHPADISKRPLREAIVKAAGKSFLTNLQNSPQLISAINQYRYTQPHFYVSPKDATPYLRSAENSILLQTSLADAISLPDIPISIIYGTLDAVMIPKNLSLIQRKRNSKKTTVHTVVAGHEIRKRYSKIIANQLRTLDSQI